MKVYFDTEFTDLLSIVTDIKLISAGFVTELGQELYFELTDHYEIKECSNFVHEAVLPHLYHAKYGLKTAQAARQLSQRLQNLGEPVQLASDAPGYDFPLIADLLLEHHCWPKCLKKKPFNVGGFVIAGRIENYFEYQPLAIRHHALWDARALAKTVKDIADD